MRQNLETEQATELTPLANANESVLEHSQVSGRKSKTEEIDTALAVLTQQSRLKMWYSSISALLLLLLVGYLPIVTFSYFTSDHFIGHAVTLLLLGGSGAFAALAMRESRKLTNTFTTYEDVRAIGPLVEATFSGGKSVRAQAAANLTRLLPRLRREDQSLLARNHRNMLAIYLGRSRWNLVLNDDDLSIAILNAYLFIGDGTELSTVKRLAQGKISSARDPRVREAAQKYLDEVQRRKNEEAMPDTLLRASEATATASDALLRAAAESTESNPQQLLRADPQQDGSAKAQEETR